MTCSGTTRLAGFWASAFFVCPRQIIAERTTTTIMCPKNECFICTSFSTGMILPLKLLPHRISMQHLLGSRCNHSTCPVGRHKFEGVDARRQVEQFPTAFPEREAAIQILLASGRAHSHL